MCPTRCVMVKRTCCVEPIIDFELIHIFRIHSVFMIKMCVNIYHSCKIETWNELTNRPIENQSSTGQLQNSLNFVTNTLKAYEPNK